MLWVGWNTEVDELENRIDELEGKDVSDLSDDSLLTQIMLVQTLPQSDIVGYTQPSFVYSVPV